MAAKKKSIDGAKLIKMVEDKVPRTEIMKKLNIKTSNQLTLLMQELKWKQARSLRLQVDVEVQQLAMPMRLRLENVGALSFQKTMAEGLGIAVGDKFSVKKTKAGIALKKI